MMARTKIVSRGVAVGFAALAGVVAAVWMAGCNDVEDRTDAARARIRGELEGQKYLDRNYNPNDTDRAPITPEGYYDVIEGAYRFIENETRNYRDRAPEIERGATISFYFDARIYRNGFEGSTTYFSNIAARRPGTVDGNWWPTDPKIITLGAGDILNGIERALVGCRAEGKTIVTDDKGVTKEVDIPSDEVRIYLTPDLAYGQSRNGNVPAGSTLVWRFQDIRIVGN